MCSPFSTNFAYEVMNASPQFKTGQFLEWIAELPSRAYAQESPVFYLKKDACFFLLKYKFSSSVKRYKIDLEFKNGRRNLESCRVHFQVGYKDEKTLSLHAGEFRISENLNFWNIPSDELTSKSCKGLKFRFYFENVFEPLLKTNREISGTAVQTPNYMDDNYLLVSVSKNYSKLFDEGVKHDVEFVCGDEIIKAHRKVLCYHSNVFESMLPYGIYPTQVQIQDMEGSIFRQFLRYLYTGVFPEVTVDDALLFYEAAHTYGVDALKTQCISFLTENMSPENACKVLILTDLHGDPGAKTNVMDYVIKEKIQFMEEKWTDFCTESPTLASEVFNLFCQRLKQKKDKSRNMNSV